MIRSPLAVFRIAIVCLPLALVASCGTSETQAIQGTRINISPIEVEVGATPTVADPGQVYYIVQSYLIELRSPSGDAQINKTVKIVNRGVLYDGIVPIMDVDVLCQGDTTPATFVPANCVDTTKTPLPSVYDAITDSNGAVRVTQIIAFFSGSSGTATFLEAFSGTAYGKTDVTLNCVEGASPCP